MTMLSNTATPKYYGEFRDKVLSGEIKVNKYISMEMNRIDALINNPAVYYDDGMVEGFICYCENECTLADGSELKLMDSFKLWAEQLFGWYYFIERSVFVPQDDRDPGHYVNMRIKKRLINKQYLIVARGAAKTMYASLVQSYFLNIDQRTTQQIAVAPTMMQADETLAPIRTSIIKARGPVMKFLTTGSLQNTTGSKKDRVKLASTKKGVENFLTGSIVEIRPMRIGKLQGLKCKVATVDEWLSTDIPEDVIGALEQSATKNGDDDYVILAISSEGTTRNGVGDSIKMELMKILKGEYNDPHTSIFYYCLDDIHEVNDPTTWVKANPNVGKTVSYETYQRDVERAEQVPSARNDILAKRFGIPLEGFTYFFTYENTIPHPSQDFWGMDCCLGGDMSLGDDFCSFTFLFPCSNGMFGIKTINYITENTLDHLPIALRLKYEDFIKEGSLIIMPGVVLNMMDVYNDLSKQIEARNYNVLCFGYDPYNAQMFVKQWVIDNGEFGVEPVPQGARTESVPLGEIKKLADQRALLFDQDMITFTMSNCITIEDTNGNRKLLKKHREHKIDAIAALIDAYVVYKKNVDLFL